MATVKAYAQDEAKYDQLVKSNEAASQEVTIYPACCNYSATFCCNNIRAIWCWNIITGVFFPATSNRAFSIYKTKVIREKKEEVEQEEKETEPVSMLLGVEVSWLISIWNRRQPSTKSWIKNGKGLPPADRESFWLRGFRLKCRT